MTGHRDLCLLLAATRDKPHPFAQPQQAKQQHCSLKTGFFFNLAVSSNVQHKALQSSSTQDSPVTGHPIYGTVAKWAPQGKVTKQTEALCKYFKILVDSASPMSGVT